MLVVPQLAGAESRKARLEVEGGCALESLAARIDDLVGRRAIDAQATAMLRVVVEHSNQGYAADVRFLDESALGYPVRRVEERSCDALADSVALVASLLMREMEQRATDPVEIPPVVATPEPLAGELLVARESGDRDHTGAPAWAYRLGVGGAWDNGGQAAIGVGGYVARGAFGAAIEVATEEPQEVRVGGMGSVLVLSARVSGGPCAQIGPVAACGFAAFGATRGRGENLVDARTVIAPQIAVVARLEWRHMVAGRFGVRAFVDVEQVLSTTRFYVDDAPVWSSPSRRLWLGTGGFLHIP